MFREVAYCKPENLPPYSVRLRFVDLSVHSQALLSYSAPLEGCNKSRRNTVCRVDVQMAQIPCYCITGRADSAGNRGGQGAQQGHRGILSVRHSHCPSLVRLSLRFQLPTSPICAFHCCFVNLRHQSPAQVHLNKGKEGRQSVSQRIMSKGGAATQHQECTSTHAFAISYCPQMSLPNRP